ncbi:Imm31 family immunity protein [Gynuella sunshinyii]|uniref:Imm31 family immunity protein n=1 Tax=Gynuella sunshinyii TaxID=1445505 RepID=UPI0005CC44F3|nr:Imm31 family immunity protein [Gynuella sunshinyii]
MTILHLHHSWLDYRRFWVFFRVAIGKSTIQELYKYYEVVKLVSSKPSLAEINGEESAILGMAQNDVGQWCYAVHILDSEEGWTSWRVNSFQLAV